MGHLDNQPFGKMLRMLLKASWTWNSCVAAISCLIYCLRSHCFHLQGGNSSRSRPRRRRLFEMSLIKLRRLNRMVAEKGRIVSRQPLDVTRRFYWWGTLPVLNILRCFSILDRESSPLHRELAIGWFGVDWEVSTTREVLWSSCMLLVWFPALGVFSFQTAGARPSYIDATWINGWINMALRTSQDLSGRRVFPVKPLLAYLGHCKSEGAPSGGYMPRTWEV